MNSTELIQHTMNWCRGELFEAKLIVLFAIISIISAFLFWKAGTTPNAKAMFIPLLLVGIMFSGIGGGMLYSNSKRMPEYKQAYEKNKIEFAESEKKRTETFISWYPKTRYIFSAVAVIGIVCFLFWAAPIGRAVGIALILMTLATFVVDHFSEERAEVYHAKIIEALK